MITDSFKGRGRVSALCRQGLFKSLELKVRNTAVPQIIRFGEKVYF